MELYCLGDSLTFGYGVKPAQRWIALASGEGWTLHNHGVCGDTTGGMLVRLHTGLLPLLRREGGAVLLCGGDNDIFYSGCASAARSNMGAMVHQLLGLGVRPILASPIPVCAEDAPKNWGGVVDFAAAAAEVARYRTWCRDFAAAFGLPFVDFYADFVAENGAVRRQLYLDGMHPTAQGHALMAARLKSVLEELA